MDLSLTQEQEMIIGLVRRFVREEILPLELQLDPDADALDAADRDRLISKTRKWVYTDWIYHQSMEDQILILLLEP